MAGLLFEAYFCMAAGKRAYDTYTQACSQVPPDQTAIGEDVQTSIWKTHRSRWYGWMLSSLASLSDAGKHQMYHLTNFVKFLGISRLGQDVLHNFGMLNTLRYSDGRRDKGLVEYEKQLR